MIIGGNGDSIFRRLMTVAGRPDMAENPAMANNAGRIVHQAAIDAALSEWCSTLNSADVIAQLEAARVPVGPIYNVADMLADPHYQARGLFEQVEIDGKPLKIPAIMPKLGKTPGRTDWPGGATGSHNEEVLRGILELSEAEIVALRSEGVIL